MKRRLRIYSTLVLALASPACAPAPPASVKCPEPPVLPKPTPPAEAPREAIKQPQKQIEITLKPVPERGAVDVELLARGDAATLSEWSIAAPDSGAVHMTSVRDDAGPLEPKLTPSPQGALSIAFQRSTRGTVHLSYSVDAHARPITMRPGVAVDPDQFEASGETLLALPDGYDNRPIHASIHLDIGAVGNQGPDAPLRIGAASSFGTGASRDVTASGSELRAATFVAGPIGQAVFDTPEGHDEAAWFGYTSFDPRPIAADVAAFRTAAREFFRIPSSPSQTLLIVTDPRPSGRFVVARRTRSVLVHVSVSDIWSAPLRIAVSAEVLHQWIGEKLWIGPDSPGHEGEAYWFTEGLTRHVARDLLFRFGLITPAELADEMHGLAGLLATSPHRSEGNASLAGRVKDRGVLPVLVARGALYAARVHGLIRHKSRGKRGLEDVLRGLMDKARERRAALPVGVWIDAMTAELGAEAAEDFTNLIEKGAPIELPDGVLGPCFRSGKRSYEAFDLGFDEEATRAASPRKIAGIKRDGPASRAGLRPDDVLLESQITHGRPEVPVTLVIERAGERKSIRYRAAGFTARAQGWVRKKDVPDEECTQ